MKAIVRYLDPSKGFECREVPIPKVVPGHALVKVMASPINPSDEYSAKGMFPPMGKEPFCCGSEGAGEIIEIGEGVPKEMLGKRVAFGMGRPSQEQFGCWCQFALVPYEGCFVVDSSWKYEDVCGFISNPLTCFGMLDIVKKKKQSAFVHTAAASGLGKMLLGLCKKEGIEIICVVRKTSAVELLKSLGAKYVLNSTETTFDKDLSALCTKLGAKICFDAIAGEMTNRILGAMPAKSSIYIYGALGGHIKELNPFHIAFKDSRVKGYTVMQAPFMHKPGGIQEKLQCVADDFKSGSRAFKTYVAKTHKLEECQEAVGNFMKFAEKGKTVFLPNA